MMNAIVSALALALVGCATPRPDVWERVKAQHQAEHATQLEACARRMMIDAVLVDRCSAVREGFTVTEAGWMRCDAPTCKTLHVGGAR